MAYQIMLKYAYRMNPRNPVEWFDHRRFARWEDAHRWIERQKRELPFFRVVRLEDNREEEAIIRGFRKGPRAIAGPKQDGSTDASILRMDY